MSLKLKDLLIEGLRDAKMFVENGAISQEEFDKLVSIDFTPKKKYIFWIVKNWIITPKNDRPTIDVLSASIKKYNDLVEKNKIEKKDINQIQDFNEFKSVIDVGEGIKSKKDKVNDYEVIVNNDDLLVVVPHTHEASRMLGLKFFAFRDEDDCAWCTTYKNEEHWNDYYYNEEITFYYILVKSEKLREKIRNSFNMQTNEMDGIALGVYPNGNKFGFSGLDHSMSDEAVEKYLKIIGLE